MIVFYLYLGGIVLLAMVLLLPAMLSQRQPLRQDRKENNIQVARDRISALENSVDETSREEIRASLLEDMVQEESKPYRPISSHWALLVALMVPVVSLGLYWQLGTPDMVQVAKDQSSQHEMDVEILLSQLEARLEQEPENVQGWQLAARTYISLNQYEKAEHAYRMLQTLDPDNPDNLAGLADALIMKAGNVYTPESRKIVESALELNPNHINALWLAGLGASSVGEYSLAISYFRQLKQILAGNPEPLQQIEMLIQRNTDLAAANQQPVVSDPVPPVSLEVVIDMDSDLRILQQDTATLYVFARATEGPPMPLAVSRVSTAGLEFPFRVTLDESMAIMPEMSIAKFDRISVRARISQSGSADPAPGDYQSTAVVVDRASPISPVTLVIDSVVD